MIGFLHNLRPFDPPISRAIRHLVDGVADLQRHPQYIFSLKEEGKKVVLRRKLVNP